MKSQQFFVFILIAVFSVTVFAQKKHPKYEGTPEIDSNFVNFINRNLGKTVYLKLSISDGEFITEGYRGVQPYFEGRKTNGIAYSFFLECKNDDILSPIEECKEAKWESNLNGGGILTGYFKVARIVRTSMRNYRAVFLIPVKPK